MFYYYYSVSGHKIVKNPPPYKGENYYCFLLATTMCVAGHFL